ncbi:MAG TPA: UDP-glucose 4-epimerase GalE [Hyphomonadaceae bacterium]|jgi:UDP-arabinose 4-epimerase|nr:UDP-glucose 4-epimerase GalE [Hyphomonadaceae bacterium]HPI48333.1 UDP-glucose 4-epimerase GalE [Hyphomonadaceae bacterium]
MAVKRILIAGGAGYIGSHAAKAVRLAGHEPVVLDDLTSGHEHAVRWGPLVRADIRNPEAVRAAIREYRPEAVMQFAARIEVGEGERDPAHFYDNNVAGTLNLVRVMLEEGVKNLVFSSTCAIYGDPEKLPLTEDLPKRPVSVYGRTKLMCEQMLEDISKAHGLNFAALRYFNAAGADPDGEIGEQHDPESHLIPNALKAAVGLGGPMKLFGTDYPTPDGTCIRDFVHVTDLAEAHILAAEKIASGRNLQLNLGSGKRNTVMDVLKAVERATGRAVPVTLFPRRPGDAVALYSDTTNVTRELGWVPKLSDIDTVVSTAWAFHRRVWGVDSKAAE